MGQNAAVEKGLKFVPHKLQQVGARCSLGLIEEGGGVLLDQAVQRGLRRSVALAVDWGAVLSPDRS